MKKVAIWVVFTLLLVAGTGIAQHDHAHHEQAIQVDADALGTVDFPITGSPETQKRFERGLALLHHMMYVLAEKEFATLAEDEPDCAMAHWGIAMTIFHPLWVGPPSEEGYKKGWTAVQKAKSTNAVSKRERAYIAAVEAFYIDWQTIGYAERIAKWEIAQKIVHEMYPNDIDAAAFYALSHLATAPKADQTFSHQKAAGALLDQLFKKAPEHPGVLHYTIHAYDNPMLAKRAVTAARAYDKIAPDVPHALHMPTHIFVRLGIWPDAISWNIRSAKAALKYPANGSISHHNPHALDYLIYAYLQTAQDKKAEAALGDLLTKTNYQQTPVSAYALAAIPARYVLERKQWADAASLEVLTPDIFPWQKFPQSEAMTWFARGLGAARTGDVANAQKTVQKFESFHMQLLEAKETYWNVIVDAQRQTVAAWIAFAKGEKDQALRMMRKAADLEDSVDKHPVTPGAVLPARELLGDMLMLLEKPAEALDAYEASLAISPNRFNSLAGAGHAARLTGNSEKAKSFYSTLVEICADADSERPELKRAKEFLATN